MRVLFQSSSHSLLLFSSEEFLRGELNKFIELSAFCFTQFHVGRFEIPPGDVRLVFATFLVNLKFTSKLNRCFLKTIYIEQIQYKFVIRFISH